MKKSGTSLKEPSSSSSPIFNQDDPQRSKLMNMFSESTLSNYQRTFKPSERTSSTTRNIPNEDDDGNADDDNSEDNNEKEDPEAADPQAVLSFDENQSNNNQDNNNNNNKDERTLFVGNLPISMDHKAINKLFQKYGKIESIRIRSIPVAGMKVDKAGDQNLVKKVSAVNHTFGDQKASFNAYIVFEEASAIEPAITENNNRLIENRHIRVDKVHPTLFDPQCSIFIGNLPYRVDEEEVREFFAKVLPNGQEDILGIRLVRDPETLMGKGIGYILFKERLNVLDAIRLHDAEFQKKWKIRVTTCSKKFLKKRNRNEFNKEIDPNQSTSRVSKKPKTEQEITAKHALKRINLKNIKTKKKMLESRKKRRFSNQSSPKGGRGGKGKGGKKTVHNKK